MQSFILLVDDNEIQAATRKAILENAGRKVLIAAHGKRALELLCDQDRSGSIRLIITDHLMPVMNGPEFVSEIRKRDFDLPIIVLSGLPDAESSYKEHDVIFRLKPFAPDCLISLVQTLLGEPITRTA